MKNIRPHMLPAGSTTRDYAEWLHRNTGRDRYDTPGSVKACACESCNRNRRIHGIPERRWRGWVAVPVARRMLGTEGRP